MAQTNRSSRVDAKTPDEPERSGGSSGVRPDPEVLAKAKRRRFSAAYKLQIVEEAEACTESGAVGALLRREGLHSSHLASWREARRAGALGALKKRRGPKGQSKATKENEKLRKENARLRRRLKQAETILEIQKKASEILGIPLRRHEHDDDA